MRSLDWQDRANCLGVDPDLMFPPAGRVGAVVAKQAKRVCAACVVSDECLRHAIETGERFGIYGGLTEGERRPLRRKYLAERGIELHSVNGKPISEHGTRSRYSVGCRCDDCRAANAAYQRRKRA